MILYVWKIFREIMLQISTDFLKSGECADNLNTFFLIFPNTEGYNSDKLKS